MESFELAEPAEKMRRQGSCLGYSQMLVAAPAGGRWAHLSQTPLTHSPDSLASAAAKTTDGVQRLGSVPPGFFLRMPVSLLSWSEGTVPGEDIYLTWPQLPYHCWGQLLTDRGCLAVSSSYKHFAASMWIKTTTACLLRIWQRFCPQRKTSQGYGLWNDRDSRLHAND